MQFQRALTVGKLLLGHNLVNLCSLRILPYLTQPDTVTQECGPSLWPLVRRSPRVSGHSGEAAPASLQPRRASSAVLTRSLGRRGARGHAVLRPAEPGPPSRKCPRQVGFRRRSLRSARATARLSPRCSVAGFHPEGAPRPCVTDTCGSLLRAQGRPVLSAGGWKRSRGRQVDRAARRVKDAAERHGRAQRGRAARRCPRGGGGGELGPAVGCSQSRTQGRGSWPGRRPGKAAAGCVC